MRKFVVAAVIIAAAAGAAQAETVYATRAMNPKLDGFTPGVTPVGRREANKGVPPKCETITAMFQYPDGTMKRESKERCSY